MVERAGQAQLQDAAYRVAGEIWNRCALERLRPSEVMTVVATAAWIIFRTMRKMTRHGRPGDGESVIFGTEMARTATTAGACRILDVVALTGDCFVAPRSAELLAMT